MNKPYVASLKCGTKEIFEMIKSKYPNSRQIIPATVYVDEGSLFLVASQEWCDWLLGKRKDMPNSANCDMSQTCGMRYKRYWQDVNVYGIMSQADFNKWLSENCYKCKYMSDIYMKG